MSLSETAAVTTPDVKAAMVLACAVVTVPEIVTASLPRPEMEPLPLAEKIVLRSV